MRYYIILIMIIGMPLVLGCAARGNYSASAKYYSNPKTEDEEKKKKEKDKDKDKGKKEEDLASSIADALLEDLIEDTVGKELFSNLKDKGYTSEDMLKKIYSAGYEEGRRGKDCDLTRSSLDNSTMQLLESITLNGKPITFNSRNNMSNEDILAIFNKTPIE